MKEIVLAALMLAAFSASADIVWLDEPGVWDRMSAGHGISQACTNGVSLLGAKCARGVRTCAPSALYLAMEGNCL